MIRKRATRERTHSRLALVAVLVAGDALTSQAPAPPLLHELRTPQPAVNDRFGEYFVAIEDIDRDGARDNAVCAREATVAGMQRAGAVYLFSGRTTPAA